MEEAIRSLFKRYEDLFAEARRGAVDADAFAACYTPEFIAASPFGVRAGRNDVELKTVVENGLAYYRSIGLNEMSVEGVTLLPIDDRHCVARVAWHSTYRVDGKSDVTIDFENAYLVQMLDSEPKIFGWVTGDEQALLREHGID